MHVFVADIYSLRLWIYHSEEEILLGRPLPPECHAELHTDYDGTAAPQR
jgi:hypothetical protein